jgi:hypothetical protein
LHPGDALLTLADDEEQPKPILAIHRIEIDPANHPSPMLVAPVCLRANALAPGIPSADLFLPPEALVRCRESGPSDAPAGSGEDPGHLIPVAALLNGLSVFRYAGPGPHVWLIPDLGTHTILLAARVALASTRPTPSSPGRSFACLPEILPGPATNAWRTRFLARAREAQFPPHPAAAAVRSRPALPESAPASPPPTSPRAGAGGAPETTSLSVLAAGAEVPCEPQGEPSLYAFLLPARTGPVRLRSTPRHAPNAEEGRRFGVCVVEIAVDGTILPIDSPAFGPGFHPPEANMDTIWRWTNGDAWLILPYSAQPRTLRIRITDWHKDLGRL